MRFELIALVNGYSSVLMKFGSLKYSFLTELYSSQFWSAVVNILLAIDESETLTNHLNGSPQLLQRSPQGNKI
jgi:hypothetical protein